MLTNKPNFFNFCELVGDHNNANSKIKKRLYMFVTEQLLKPVDGVFNGQLRCVIIQCVTDWYRRTIFTPFQLIKKMNRSNHVLSLCGIELLRSMIPGKQKKINKIIYSHHPQPSKKLQR